MSKQFLQPIWFVLMFSTTVFAQTPTPDAATWVAEIGSRYWVAPNLTYLVADNEEAKLDVYVSRSASATTPVPTVIFIHGGGWEGGDKNAMVLRLLPYLEMGWSAVNVNYRAGAATAPAAVEDCRCALRWVIRNAQKYNINVNKLVVTGESAGSHLALTTGMLLASAGLDGACSGPEDLKVAAIINWYGVTDVVDVLEGANQQGFAVRWLSGLTNPKEIARQVSPLQYVRPGLPAILTIHGDADRIAPYSHAVRLHQALDAAKVPNQLLTIAGGTHGDFKRDEFIRIYATIREFLQKHGIDRQPTATKPTARGGHCFVYDEQLRKVVLLDGYPLPDPPKLGEAWAWDGRRWELIPSSGPAARFLGGAAYDSRRKKTVLYGGAGASPSPGQPQAMFNDTWEWDGKNWQQMADISAGTRNHHVMAYDEARGKTVVYGGASSHTPEIWEWTTDTWEWNGMKWSKVATQGPAGRVHSAMVYDSKRQRVILFGGRDKDDKRYNDTWAWDGKTWEKISNAGPPPRSNHRMVFDRRAGVILLYGGDEGMTETSSGRSFIVREDMWQWDGKQWTEIRLSGPTPGKRIAHAMAYDVARSRVVLYGGGEGGQKGWLNDLWEWDGKQWMQIE